MKKTTILLMIWALLLTQNVSAFNVKTDRWFDINISEKNVSEVNISENDLTPFVKSESWEYEFYFNKLLTWETHYNKSYFKKDWKIFLYKDINKVNENIIISLYESFDNAKRVEVEKESKIWNILKSKEDYFSYKTPYAKVLFTLKEDNYKNIYAIKDDYNIYDMWNIKEIKKKAEEMKYITDDLTLIDNIDEKELEEIALFKTNNYKIYRFHEALENIYIFKDLSNNKFYINKQNSDFKEDIDYFKTNCYKDQKAETDEELSNEFETFLKCVQINLKY